MWEKAKNLWNGTWCNLTAEVHFKNEACHHWLVIQLVSHGLLPGYTLLMLTAGQSFLNHFCFECFVLINQTQDVLDTCVCTYLVEANMHRKSDHAWFSVEKWGLWNLFIFNFIYLQNNFWMHYSVVFVCLYNNKWYFWPTGEWLPWCYTTGRSVW